MTAPAPPSPPTPELQPPTGRRLPVGAEPVAGGISFRVWAPATDRLEVVLAGSGRRFSLDREEQGGYFSGVISEMRAGERYKLSMDGGEPFPDPASKFQPEGPHGASEVVDPAFRWGDAEARWRGVCLDRQVLYELHIGTFTPAGTFTSAIAELPRLREMGITVLEIMPVAEFAGSVGWGYDGVALFAPYHHYGRPEDLRRLVQAAHAEGLGVILDVVYNHLGPDGNYLLKFSPYYFASEATEWGLGINFDGEHSRPVREFFLANARQWIEDYHFDGLRLDATQAIQDKGTHGKHIVREIVETVRAAAAGRETIMLAENEPQDSSLVRPAESGGFGLDAVWNDDFHHSAVVCLTGQREAYYSDHLGRPQEFISAVKYGYLYQGQFYSWQRQRRGVSSLGISPKAFVIFLENHDQVANFGCAQRIRTLTNPARYRAMTALWLLTPGTPMFFMGQEFGATTPFHYFAGHGRELARAVSQGRANFMRQFASQDTPEMRACFLDPEVPEAVNRSRLDPTEYERHPEIVRLHRDLLELRRTDPVIQRQEYGRIDGAVLSEACFVLRYLTDTAQDRLLVVNFGTTLDLPHLPEPLTAPPAGREWEIQWASEWPRYGGCGASAPGRFGAWRIGGESAVLLRPVAAAESAGPEPEKSGLRPGNGSAE